MFQNDLCNKLIEFFQLTSLFHPLNETTQSLFTILSYLVGFHVYLICFLKLKMSAKKACSPIDVSIPQTKMDVKSAKQSGKHIPGKRFRYMM